MNASAPVESAFSQSGFAESMLPEPAPLFSDEPRFSDMPDFSAEHSFSAEPSFFDEPGPFAFDMPVISPLGIGPDLSVIAPPVAAFPALPTGPTPMLDLRGVTPVVDLEPRQPAAQPVIPFGLDPLALAPSAPEPFTPGLPSALPGPIFRGPVEPAELPPLNFFGGPLSPVTEPEPITARLREPRSVVPESETMALPRAAAFQTRAQAKAAWATGRGPASVPPAPAGLPSALPTQAGPREESPRRAAARRRAKQPSLVSTNRGRVVVGATAAAVGLVGLGAAWAKSASSDPDRSTKSASNALIATTAEERQVSEAGRPPSSSLAQGLTGMPGSDRAAFRMTAVARSQERGPIGGCSGTVSSTSYGNGQMPSSMMCDLPFAEGHRLRADAAVQLIRLNEAYKGKFGEDICLTDSYRSLSSQYSLYARKPGLAARPGTSEHGLGLAVDMCDGPDQPNSERRDWFLANAPDYGWDNPSWARPGGSRPEPWHWEFVRGQ